MMNENASMGQERLEKHAERTVYENNVLQKETLNGMMKASVQSCSFEEGTLTFEFPVQQWQANRVGKMHGGAICTAFDLTIAALARFYARENFAPTISIDVKFVRPVDTGDALAVTAKAVSAGRRITQLTGEARRISDGRIVATAASVYMNADTSKEQSKKD